MSALAFSDVDITMWGGIVGDPDEQMMIRRREYACFVLSEMGFCLVSTRNEDLFCVSAFFSIFF